jgi:hypothetical protein
MPTRDAPHITEKQQRAKCSSERAARPDALCVMRVNTRECRQPSGVLDQRVGISTCSPGSDCGPRAP